MVRVRVIGDREVATAPVHRALTRMPGVEVLDREASPGSAAVDTVVIEGSLGSGRAPEGLQALAAVYPRATFLVIALHRGDEYRWVHVRPDDAAFRVYEAGTGTLPAILAASLGGAAGDRHGSRHATLPAIPCSTA